MLGLIIYSRTRNALVACDDCSHGQYFESCTMRIDEYMLIPGITGNEDGIPDDVRPLIRLKLLRDENQ